MHKNPYIVGLIAAGVFSTVMVVFSAMGVFVLIPVLFGALPVYVAALGWGTRAGIVATIAIVAFTAIAADPASGLLIGMMIAAPAALAGHQANLAQPDPHRTGQLQWYPLSQILYWITLLIIAAILVFGLIVDFDPSALAAEIAPRLELLLAPVEGGPEFSIEESSKAIELNLRILPFVLPSVWIGIHVLNFLLAMRIARRMEVLARPDEDIAAGFNLPHFAAVMLVVALAGMMFTSAPLSYGFAVAAGALTMAFSVVGLAVLHQRSRGWSGRLALLVITYVMISLIFFPVYLFSFSGIFKSVRAANAGKATNSDD
jgi:hypothetical protein